VKIILEVIATIPMVIKTLLKEAMILPMEVTIKPKVTKITLKEIMIIPMVTKILLKEVRIRLMEAMIKPKVMKM